jgi:hypothetical protein
MTPPSNQPPPQSAFLPSFEVVVRSIDDGLRFARLAAALAADVPDAVNIDEAQLTQVLASASPTVSERLAQLQQAYSAWIDFHRSVQDPGRLTDVQSVEQANVHTNLEAARSAFLEELRRIGMSNRTK